MKEKEEEEVMKKRNRGARERGRGRRVKGEKEEGRPPSSSSFLFFPLMWEMGSAGNGPLSPSPIFPSAAVFSP